MTASPGRSHANRWLENIFVVEDRDFKEFGPGNIGSTNHAIPTAIGLVRMEISSLTKHSVIANPFKAYVFFKPDGLLDLIFFGHFSCTTGHANEYLDDWGQQDVGKSAMQA